MGLLGLPASRWLDIWVACHGLFAFSFASVMLFRPTAFELVTADEFELDYDAKTVIRWSATYPYAFATIAFLSLKMPPAARRTVAANYVFSFMIAVAAGLHVQSTGRWNAFHAIYVAVFAVLALVYGAWVVLLPDAFDRPTTPHFADTFSGDSTTAGRILNVFVILQVSYVMIAATLLVASPTQYMDRMWSHPIKWTSETESVSGTSIDSVRWAFPFVLGGATLAALSLRMPAAGRKLIALVFVVEGVVGLAINAWITATADGMYNMVGEMVVFGCFVAGYGVVLTVYPEACGGVGGAPGKSPVDVAVRSTV